MATIPGFRLGRASVTVFRNKSVTDDAQVPASGATVRAYVAGADCKSATGSGIAHLGTGTINVWQPQDIRVGDTLMNASTLLLDPTATSPAVTVTDLEQQGDLGWNIAVSNASGASFTWLDEDRMVVTSRRPTLYKDSAGKRAHSGTTQATTDSAGLAEFYAYAPVLDLIVTGGGTVASIWKNQPAGERTPVLNINDYGGKIKDALAAIAADTWYESRGVEIYCPPGTYVYDSADLDIDIDVRVTIQGAGNRSSFFIVEGTLGNNDKDFFRVNMYDVQIRDLSIKYSDAATAGTGHAIAIGDAYGDRRAHVLIENVDIEHSPDSAILIGTDDSTIGYADVVIVRRCNIGGTQAGADVEILNQTTTCRFEDVSFEKLLYTTESPTGVYRVRLESCANVHFLNCNFQPSDTSTPAVFLTTRGIGSATHNNDHAANIVFESCDFESDESVGAATTPLVHAYGTSGLVIRDSIFYNFGSGVLLDTTHSALIANCLFKNLGGSGYTVKVDDSVNTRLSHNWHEKTDDSPDFGARYNIAVTTAGANPGLTIEGGGLTVPIFADDAERDATSYSSGVDIKGARTVDGTIIFVANPTSPSSHFQIYFGGWIGIAKQAGGAI